MGPERCDSAVEAGRGCALLLLPVSLQRGQRIQRESFIDNLLVRIHLIIEKI